MKGNKLSFLSSLGRPYIHKVRRPSSIQFLVSAVQSRDFLYCRHMVIVSLTTLSGFDRVSQGPPLYERPGPFTKVKATTYW